jgi:thioredoxin 1
MITDDQQDWSSLGDNIAMSERVAQIAEKDFESVVLESEQAVLVDFWASWCGPCKTVSPTLEALAEEYAGRLNIVKIDVDEAPELAARFGVRGVPTLMLFLGGNVEASKVGAMPRAQLAAFLDANL